MAIFKLGFVKCAEGLSDPVRTNLGSMALNEPLTNANGGYKGNFFKSRQGSVEARREAHRVYEELRIKLLGNQRNRD